MHKRIMVLAAGLIWAALLLTGCSRSSQVENQAYVLVMGIDQTDDGQLQLSVQLPKISGGGSGEASGGQSSSGNYTQISITAESFETALEKLDWAAPRDLNLSHLKLIVLSENIAKKEDCRKIIRNIAQTERLFTAARVAVCQGKAKEFVEAMQPVIGTRISTDIDAMFEHYISSGYVPQSRLADLFYQTESVYSDPMITYAILDKSAAEKSGNKGEQKAAQAAVLSGTLQEISSSYESDIPTRYLGAAVFADGQMKGVLSGTQTIIANLLRNEADTFRYKCDEQSLEIVPTRQVFVRVDAGEEGVNIRIDAKLSISSQEQMPDEESLKISLMRDIVSTISAAQQMGAEPFGFAEKAAKSFRTMDEWVRYNWRNHFKNANIEIKLNFTHSDT